MIKYYGGKTIEGQSAQGPGGAFETPSVDTRKFQREEEGERSLEKISSFFLHALLHCLLAPKPLFSAISRIFSTSCY